jgi:hypothetical protein
VEEIAARNDIPAIARMPMDPLLAAACDKGMIEMFDGNWLEQIADAIQAL